MRKIKLTQGKYTLVDDEDYEYLNQWRWHAHETHSGNFYAERKSSNQNKKRITIRMHREILRPRENFVCDHINGDGLDNRRINLRICSFSGNVRNSRVRKDNSSGVKGVYFQKRYRNWKAYIYVNEKYIHLGCFKNVQGAALAYNRAAQKYFGKFARLNEV